MTAKEHNRLAGIFLLAHGGLQAAIMLFLCIFYAVAGSAIFLNNADDNGAVIGAAFVLVTAAVALVTIFFVVPQIVGGYMLIRERPNARTWGILGSVLSCLSFPLGTAAGVYGLWFLFGEHGRQFYLGDGRNILPAQPRPPAPNSWQ